MKIYISFGLCFHGNWFLIGKQYRYKNDKLYQFGFLNHSVSDNYSKLRHNKINTNIFCIIWAIKINITDPNEKNTVICNRNFLSSVTFVHWRHYLSCFKVTLGLIVFSCFKFYPMFPLCGDMMGTDFKFIAICSAFSSWHRSSQNVCGPHISEQF